MTININFQNIKDDISNSETEAAILKCDEGVYKCEQLRGQMETLKSEMVAEFGENDLFDNFDTLIAKI